MLQRMEANTATNRHATIQPINGFWRVYVDGKWQDSCELESDAVRFCERRGWTWEVVWPEPGGRLQRS